MPRKIGYWLAISVAAACVVRAAWSGAPGNPATLIDRVSALVVAGLIALLHWPVRRRFGPIGTSWTARIVRVAGFVLVGALILVKAAVERHEFARLGGRPALTGVWAGEIAFLLVIAAYLTGLLAITARRPPASRATIVIGTGTGVLLGLAVYVLRPLDNPMHITDGWLSALFQITKVMAVPAVFAAATAAVVMAARRAPRRDQDGTVPPTQIRARQGSRGRPLRRHHLRPAGVRPRHQRPSQSRRTPPAASSGRFPAVTSRSNSLYRVRSRRQPRCGRLPADPDHLPVPRRWHRRLGRTLRGGQPGPAARRRRRRRHEAAAPEDPEAERRPSARRESAAGAAQRRRAC